MGLSSLFLLTMPSFTWQDVFNHLQSCSPDELNREVQVNVHGGDYMTLSGICTEYELGNGEYQPVPVLEY